MSRACLNTCFSLILKGRCAIIRCLLGILCGTIDYSDATGFVVYYFQVTIQHLTSHFITLHRIKSSFHVFLCVSDHITRQASSSLSPMMSFTLHHVIILSRPYFFLHQSVAICIKCCCSTDRWLT